MVDLGLLGALRQSVRDHLGMREQRGLEFDLAWDTKRLAWWGEFLAGRGVHYVQALSPDDIDAGKAVLYERGHFTRADTMYVWGILAGSTVGLLASTLARLYASTPDAEVIVA